MTPDSAAAAIGLVAGFFCGMIHFASLRWNARLFAIGAAGKAFSLQLARLAVTIAILATLAQLGAFGILCGALGFLLARPLLLRPFGGLR